MDPQTHLEGNVVVVGGGSTAMDAARSALRTGATTVHVLYRRTRAEMPAQAEEVRAALEESIQLHELVTPKALVGTEDAHIHSIHCQGCEDALLASCCRTHLEKQRETQITKGSQENIEPCDVFVIPKGPVCPLCDPFTVSFS